MTKIESVEVIPSRKDTIFGDEYVENEVFNITHDYDVWLSNWLDVSEKMILNGFTEMEGEKFLKTMTEFRPYAETFKSYMLGPVAKDGTDMLMARIRRVPSMEHLADYDFSDCYLYGLMVTRVIDPASGVLNDELKLRYAGTEAKIV